MPLHFNLSPILWYGYPIQPHLPIFNPAPKIMSVLPLLCYTYPIPVGLG